MRRLKLLILAALCLALAGCSLARPEAAESGGGDRWIGFYVVPSQGYADHLANNPYLEEYGEFSAETDQFGTLTFSQDVLFAVEDEAGNYSFPGMEEGYSLFIYQKYGQEGGDRTVGVVSNMAPGEETTQMKYTDEGDLMSASGTVYFGPPLGAANSWDPYTCGVIWRYYRVYQTEDGRIYLNGDGDSTNGPMSHTATETYTSTRNGETVQGETAVEWAEGAAWALVEEVSAEGTVRTVYSVPAEDEDPVSHQVVLLDDQGMGVLAYLNIQ